MRKTERLLTVDQMRRDNSQLRMFVDQMDEELQKLEDNGIEELWLSHFTSYQKAVEKLSRLSLHLRDRATRAIVGHPYAPKSTDVILNQDGAAIEEQAAPKKRARRKRG